MAVSPSAALRADRARCCAGLDVLAHSGARPGVAPHERGEDILVLVDDALIVRLVADRDK
jgi:hypothetical protein